MDDVGREIAMAKLQLMKQSAKPQRDHIRAALRNGTRPEYLSMRYGIPVEQILYAKAKWEREDEQERNAKRARQRAFAEPREPDSVAGS